MPHLNASISLSALQDDAAVLAAYLGRARLSGRVGEQARSSVVTAYYPWIYQRCLKTLGNEADANDVAQEVALSLYLSLASFEGRSSLRTWLNRIIRNECVNLIRKRQKAALTSQITALILIFEEAQRSTPERCEISEESLHRAIKMLPPEQREVLQLRFFAELPIAEISQLLGISLSAAKMRLYRSLDELKVLFFSGEASDVSHMEAG